MESYNIGKLVSSQLITKLCDKMLLISSVWFMTIHYGKQWLTLLLVVSALPHLLCAFFSGKLIRKLTPLITMIVSDYIRGLLFLVVSGCFYFYQQSSPITLLFIFFGTNCAAAFFNPAMLTLPLEIAGRDKLQRVMSLVSGTVAISGIIGPALAMLFYRIDGLFLIFIISGVTYFIAASLEMTIKVQKKYQIKDNSNEGITSLNWWEYIRHYKLIFQLLLVFFFMSLFLVPLQLYIPIYSKFVFHGNFQTLSLMEISLGIGTLLATLLLSIFQWNRSLWFQVFIAYLVMSLAYLLFAVNSISSLAFICLFVLGFSSGIGNIIILNVFQRYPNQKDVPGIMVCVNFTSIASAPFGLLMAGIFLNSHEIHFQVTIYALITILLALVIAILPEFKHFPKKSIRNEQAVI